MLSLKDDIDVLGTANFYGTGLGAIVAQIAEIRNRAYSI